MLKTSLSLRQPSTPGGFFLLRDLFPLITVILSLFIFFVAYESVEFASSLKQKSTKSSPIVRNEELLSLVKR
jgi:hypothetical protein